MSRTTSAILASIAGTANMVLAIGIVAVIYTEQWEKCWYLLAVAVISFVLS